MRCTFASLFVLALSSVLPGARGDIVYSYFVDTANPPLSTDNFVNPTFNVAANTPITLNVYLLENTTHGTTPGTSLINTAFPNSLAPGPTNGLFSSQVLINGATGGTAQFTAASTNTGPFNGGSNQLIIGATTGPTGTNTLTATGTTANIFEAIGNGAANGVNSTALAGNADLLVVLLGQVTVNSGTGDTTFTVGAAGLGNTDTNNDNFYNLDVTNDSDPTLIADGLTYNGAANNPTTFELITPAVIPEPGSLALLSLSALGAAAHAWRRKRRAVTAM